MLWRWRAGECIAHVRAHDDPGRVALFLSPADGTCRIASASDASLKFWAVASGGAGEFTFLQPAEAEAAGAAATTCAVDLGGGGNYGEQSALQNLCGDAAAASPAPTARCRDAVLGGKRGGSRHHGPGALRAARRRLRQFVSGGADGRVRQDGALGLLTSVDLGTRRCSTRPRRRPRWRRRWPARRPQPLAAGGAAARGGGGGDGDGDGDGGITSSTLLVATAGEVPQFDPTTGAWRVLLQAHEADGGVSPPPTPRSAGGGAGGPTMVAAQASASSTSWRPPAPTARSAGRAAACRWRRAARCARVVVYGGGARLAVGDVDGVAHLMRRQALIVVAASRVAAADGAAVTALVFCGDAALVAVGDAAAASPCRRPIARARGAGGAHGGGWRATLRPVAELLSTARCGADGEGVWDARSAPCAARRDGRRRRRRRQRGGGGAIEDARSGGGGGGGGSNGVARSTLPSLLGGGVAAATGRRVVGAVRSPCAAGAARLSADGGVELVDVDSPAHARVTVLAAARLSLPINAARGGLAGCLTFSADGGRLICSASEGGGFLVWEVASLAAAAAAVGALQPRGMASVALASSTVASDSWAMEDDESSAAAAADSMEAAVRSCSSLLLSSGSGDAITDALEAALGHPWSGEGGGGWMKRRSRGRRRRVPSRRRAATPSSLWARSRSCRAGGRRDTRVPAAHRTYHCARAQRVRRRAAQPQYIHVYRRRCPRRRPRRRAAARRSRRGCALRLRRRWYLAAGVDGGGAGAPPPPRLRLWSWRRAAPAAPLARACRASAAVVAPVTEAVAHPSLPSAAPPSRPTEGRRDRERRRGARPVWRRVGASPASSARSIAAARRRLRCARGRRRHRAARRRRWRRFPPAAAFCGTDGGELAVYRGDAVVRQVTHSAHACALAHQVASRCRRPTCY